MMHRIELVAWLALASTAAASAINARNCLQLEVPVSVAVNNYKILQPKIYSDSGMAEWLWDVTSWSGPNLTERLIGIDPIDEIFNVHAQLCVPPQGKRAGILQLATHGGGFDSRYWDVAIKPEQYSYVDATIAEGYSILTYDRLGTGQSDHPEANKVQSPVHIAIIKGLTDLARAGKLAQYSTTKGSIVSKHYKPSKIVHVGHSIGSYLTNGFLSAYGNLSDGAILTGFLYSSKLGVVGPGYFDFQYARDQDPYLFGDRGEGYFVQGSKTAIKFNFLKYGTYEPELAQYGYDVRQTFTGSELHTVGLALGTPATAFTGPIQFVLGEYDTALCQSNCTGIYDLATHKAFFPAASDINIYLQPGTGHGLTMSLNATAGFKVSYSFLEAHGL